MRDKVVWDDEERDDVMNMTDRVMGYQSFQRASSPANVLQTCERMEREREGKHLLAAGTSDPTIQSVKFLRLWASKHGFFTLATVQLLCMLPQLVSASVTGQFGARCAPSTAQGWLWHTHGSWFTSAAVQGLICGRPGVQPAAPNKMKKGRRLSS